MFSWNRWSLAPLALVLAACAVPPLFVHSPELALALQRAFALVCHQQPQRSFVLFGGSVAVCARCLGIYLGAAAGLMVRVSRRVAWRWLIAAVAINLVDWLAEFAGVHGNWMGARFALGLLLGAVAAMMIATAEKTRTPAKEPWGAARRLAWGGFHWQIRTIVAPAVLFAIARVRRSGPPRLRSRSRTQYSPPIAVRLLPSSERTAENSRL